MNIALILVAYWQNGLHRGQELGHPRRYC